MANSLNKPLVLLGWETIREAPPPGTQLMESLRQLIYKAAILGHTKPTLLRALRGELRPFLSLMGTMNEVAIMTFISRRISADCPFEIRMDELRNLWY